MEDDEKKYLILFLTCSQYSIFTQKKKPTFQFYIRFSDHSVKYTVTYVSLVKLH